MNRKEAIKKLSEFINVNSVEEEREYLHDCLSRVASPGREK